MLETKDPAIAAGASNVFLAAKTGPLTAYALADGHQVWTNALRAAQPPVVSGDLLFVAQDGVLFALDQATGRERWHAATGELAVPPLAQAGWLFVPAKDGSILALRSTDGSEVWRQSLAAPAAASMAVDGDRLFIPLRDARVVALAINANGALLWTCLLDSPGGSPLAASDRVYLGSTTGEFYSVKQKDGRVAWRHTRIGMAVVGHPVMGDSRLFIATLDNRIVALDPDGGAQLWWETLNARPAEQLMRDGAHLLSPVATGEIAILPEKTGKSLTPIPAPKAAGIRLAAPVVIGGPPDAPVLLRITMGSDAVPVLESFKRGKS